MKRLCKHVDITDISFIKESIRECLKNKNKRRKDIKKLLNKYQTIDDLAYTIQKELKERKLVYPPIWTKEIVDSSSNKIRTIGIQNIKQQIYDYIAVRGLDELTRRIGMYQCSYKGKGQVYGAKVIYRWMREKDVKYACQFDIQKYYDSVPHDKLLTFLKKHVKNDDLLWLIEELLKSFKSGLSIGSYLSQLLANLYLSELYHYMESLYKIRRGRRVKLAKHFIFYMDDIVVLGSNARDMHKVAEAIIEKANEMGLFIKPSWRVYKLGYVDMMGYKIYKDYIEVRKRNWKRIRRAFLRFDSKNVDLARRVIAYYGLIKHTNYQNADLKYKINKMAHMARRIVSNESKVQRKATFCFNEND